MVVQPLPITCFHVPLCLVRLPKVLRADKWNVWRRSSKRAPLPFRLACMRNWPAKSTCGSWGARAAFASMVITRATRCGNWLRADLHVSQK
eukprot:820190-Pyramimonas_sp.AAC.1